ncbi:hypothetical protein GBAR_LOCUS11361, partial [Geodia barretti]
MWVLTMLWSFLPFLCPSIGLPAICDGGSPTSGTGSLCSFQPRNSRDTEQVCHQFTVPHNRRSVREELKGPRLHKRQSTFNPKHLSMDPTPFNLAEHG